MCNQLEPIVLRRLQDACALGRITFSDGAPVSGVSVHVVASYIDEANASQILTSDVVSAADGTFCAPTKTFGSVIAVASLPGYWGETAYLGETGSAMATCSSGSSCAAFPSDIVLQPFNSPLCVKGTARFQGNPLDLALREGLAAPYLSDPSQSEAVARAMGVFNIYRIADDNRVIAQRCYDGSAPGTWGGPIDSTFTLNDDGSFCGTYPTAPHDVDTSRTVTRYVMPQSCVWSSLLQCVFGQAMVVDLGSAEAGVCSVSDGQGCYLYDIDLNYYGGDGCGF